MNKYVITKELEIDEDCREMDVVGVFDTKEVAKQTAEKMFEEMPEHEKQFYEILVWEVPEDSLEEKDDEIIFTSGTCEIFFPEEAGRCNDESLELLDSDKYCDPDNIVHYCVSPFKDGIRLWIGCDSDKYVDRVLMGVPGETEKCLEDWFKEYGKFEEESWEECFPKKNREIYIRSIKSKGKTYEEALEILRYLPQTCSIIIEENVLKMIELWENGARIIEPYRTPLWKKKVLQGDKDLWKEDIRSPTAERAYKEGWLAGRAELVKSMSEDKGMTYQEVMEYLEVSAEDQGEILKLIDCLVNNEQKNDRQ